MSSTNKLPFGTRYPANPGLQYGYDNDPKIKINEEAVEITANDKGLLINDEEGAIIADINATNSKLNLTGENNVIIISDQTGEENINLTADGQIIGEQATVDNITLQSDSGDPVLSVVDQFGDVLLEIDSEGQITDLETLDTGKLNTSSVKTTTVMSDIITSKSINLEDELLILDQYDNIATSITSDGTVIKNLDISSEISINAQSKINMPDGIWNSSSYSTDTTLIVDEIKETPAIFASSTITITLPASSEFDVDSSMYILSIFNIGTDTVTVEAPEGFNQDALVTTVDILTKNNTKFGLFGGGEDGAPSGIFIL